MSYCEIAKGHPVHGPHHDTEYGRPVADDAVLFERIALEINQAGLSWLLVLNKRAALNAAFEGFDPATVAAYGPAEVERLLADAGIIRNRRKIEAVIENARRISALKPGYGGLKGWLDAHHPRPLGGWVKLMRATFVFMGPEVVNEFLMSIGYLPGAHDADCPVGREIAALNPAWMQAAPPGGW
ncbi:MAG: DNA-3-methyladenine glycosylase I [Alphaproteobacteria bacterium]|nr:DNA-3-methyladenine glycosylase I [Alphaproteobacteria bacterium]